MSALALGIKQVLFALAKPACPKLHHRMFAYGHKQTFATDSSQIKDSQNIHLLRRQELIFLNSAHVI